MNFALQIGGKSPPPMTPASRDQSKSAVFASVCLDPRRSRNRATGWIPRCPSARDYRNIRGLRGRRPAQTGAHGVVLSVSLPSGRTSPGPGTACALPAGIPSPLRQRSRGSRQGCVGPGVSRRRRQRRGRRDQRPTVRPEDLRGKRRRLVPLARGGTTGCPPSRIQSIMFR